MSILNLSPDFTLTLLEAESANPEVTVTAEVEFDLRGSVFGIHSYTASMNRLIKFLFTSTIQSMGTCVLC